METFYKIGDLYISITGNENNLYCIAFKKYFQDKEIIWDGEKIDLRIEVRNPMEDDSFFNPKLFSLSENIAFNKEWYRIRKVRYSYAVKDLFFNEKTTELVLFPRTSWTSEIKRIGSVILGSDIGGHDKYNKFVSSLANYSCLWYIFAMAFMKKGSIFVHCGIVSKNDHGMLLTGTSGCGKTSTMMELITNSGYSFMGEDFGILRRDGRLFDMQKKAAVYQSDVKWGNGFLLSAVKSLSPSLKINWKIKKFFGKNPRYYFKPSEIFDKNIVHHSQLEEAFILKRVPKECKLTCAAIHYTILAERMKSASFREIKELYEILNNIRAVGGDEYYQYYPSVLEIENEYLKIAKKALQDVCCYEIAVPLNIAPKQIALEMQARRKTR